jgi:hypothetical protein
MADRDADELPADAWNALALAADSGRTAIRAELCG